MNLLFSFVIGQTYLSMLCTMKVLSSHCLPARIDWLKRSIWHGCLLINLECQKLS